MIRLLDPATNTMTDRVVLADARAEQKLGLGFLPFFEHQHEVWANGEGPSTPSPFWCAFDNFVVCSAAGSYD
jgi:hypothetical protein